MEGTFWSTMLVFAPLWSWLPLGLVQAPLLFATGLPLYLRLIPLWLWLLSFGPLLYGWMMNR